MTTLTLADLDFGELAAESDDRLIDYFVVTPVAERIFTKKTGLVLGRKGSGKTALFRQTEELLEKIGQPHIKVIRLNMDDHAWAAFSDFKKLGLSPEHAATVSWQLALLVQLAAHIASETSITWSQQASKDVAVLRNFINDNFGEVTPELTRASKLIGQVESLSLGAFGTSLGATFRHDEGPRELAPAIADAVSQHLVRPLLESAWVLLLDQLDESWDGSDEKKDLLVGLLKAVKRVNDDFAWTGEPYMGARAIAFLRADINDSLRFDDKDKHRASSVEIRWSHEQLREMLQNRLENIDVDDIFDSKTTQRKGRIPKGSFNYVVSRTFMRPRDLIQLLTEIQKDFPEADKITKRLMEFSEKSYSRNKVDDLRNEYRKAAPWVEVALDALRSGPNKFDSRADLDAYLEANADRAEMRDLRVDNNTLVDWMIEASILGSALRRTATETIRFRCEGEPVSVEGDSTAWVHPALFAGLALTEPRAARSTTS